MFNSGKSLHIDKTISSLKINGGVDCYKGIGITPDLNVSGGGMIKKSLCIGGNSQIKGNLSVNGDLALNGDLTLNGNAYSTINGNTYNILNTNSLIAGNNINFIYGNSGTIQIDSTASSNVPPLLPSSMRIVYVRKGGSDLTGDGTISNPFLTIPFAMTTITDASTNKRYMIDLGPGLWQDNFSWKGWVFIRGSTALNTRMNSVMDINDPSWGVPGPTSDVRSGGQDLNFGGTLTLDFSLQNSQFGKFYFWNCNMNNTLVSTGVNPINQIYISGGLWFNGITSSGVNITTNCVDAVGGTFTFNSSSTASSFLAFGGGQIGSLSVNVTTGIPPSVTLIDSPVLSTLTITGPGASVSATNSSLPLQTNISLIGGGTINRLTDAYSLAYSPTTPAQWNGAPTSLSNAIDRIASLLYTLNANTPIP